MARVLVAYTTVSGNTEKMAQYVSEGVRFSGGEVVLKNVSAINKFEDLEGFDGYIFGSPTYYLDIAAPMKTFLFLAKKAALKGKLAGSFGSYTHDGNAPKIILETMEHVFKMEPFNLGPFNLKEELVDATEGMRACQDYGRAFNEKLG